MVAAMPLRRLVVAISIIACVALVVVMVSDDQTVELKDMTSVYGHHPFLKQKPEFNVFQDLPTKPHGPYKKYKPEYNIYDTLGKDAESERRLWIMDGHKWHHCKDPKKKCHGRSNDFNVFNKKIKLYKWHHCDGKSPCHGRSDSFNVFDDYVPGDHNPEYDKLMTGVDSKKKAKK